MIPFVARDWDATYDQLNASYSTGNEIVYSTERLKPNLRDYNNVYILVRGYITMIGRNLWTEAAFKNCAPFIKFITKIDGRNIDDTEGLNFIMSMYQIY